jgi:hypothetical protein
MAGRLKLEEKKDVKRLLKVFANLLKEFPKRGTEEFIYDESTLKKIENCRDAMTEMATLLNKKTTSLDHTDKNAVKESLIKLSSLIDELPTDPADEFLYDRSVHKMVEYAREAIANLGHIFA